MENARKDESIVTADTYTLPSPIILSGAKITEGYGLAVVMALGKQSSYG